MLRTDAAKGLQNHILLGLCDLVLRPPRSLFGEFELKFDKGDWVAGRGAKKGEPACKSVIVL